ncbi:MULTISPECIES: glutathione-disulfide reductase [Alphaproteobacteria]|uniref:Glutathione-disulfide reductase n=1 Tax=Qipengyuania oceanensis TaxID=1463597 RepID=A0A844YJ39_9SPHN|nr:MULTISPECIES: glutathione-disulfide reductase [Alphaproteobacteria]MBO6693764.1 glutathione-disulfide reductase [Parvibaculum sp.]MXO64141.1 glutathione-disulfide reductase [Qipengyuania oceanensis]
MAEDYDYDLFTIGAGSGGVRASRVAASHGARVAAAEEFRVGGTCVIRGCVPKKMLVYGSMFAEELGHAQNLGWTIEGKSFGWATLRDFVNADVDRLEGLYGQTLANHEVEVFAERATITGPHSVRLSSGREVTAKYILVATGARPAMPQFPGVEHCISSNEVFHLARQPQCLMVVGGGYIAMEFAGIFNALGSEVTVVNRTDRILRSYDEQIVDRMLHIAMGRGIDFRMHSQIKSVEKDADGCLQVDLGGARPVAVDQILIATGRSPNTEGLGLENAAIELGKGGEIPVDEYNRTSCDSIYAVGDVTDRVQLTPVAIREGHAFADTVFGGKPRTIDYSAIPSAVFSQPPLAGVGLTEAEARRVHGDVKVYSSDFRPMKNIFSEHPERGLYKMIVDETSEKILGIHMIGPEAPEILQVAAVAVKAGLTKQAFDDTVALHPSMAEELVLLK